MEKPDGIAEINGADWIEDSTKTLNLFVHTAANAPVHCWLTLRPPYCDRGHIQLNIDGPLGLDYNDSFPRFFFTFEEADHHCRTFLKWRLWKERVYPHVLRGKDMDGPQGLAGVAGLSTARSAEGLNSSAPSTKTNLRDYSTSELMAEYIRRDGCG